MDGVADVGAGIDVVAPPAAVDSSAPPFTVALAVCSSASVLFI